MNLNDWRRSGKFFDYKGFPVFYRRSAAPEEVTLCLHGFPSSSHDYHKIWNDSAREFPLLAFDMIGYGF
ncbi:MAG TPA: alpha/beta hydrolase, partial [Pyrinomonadaceae bacterium]